MPLSKYSPTTFSLTEARSPISTNDSHFSKKRIIKNLLVISFTWFILFSAYDCLLMLQSTLNSEEGIGVISVAVQFAGGCVVALMFPKYCIKKLGCKRVILASIMFHIPYIAANFYPHWILMIPSSLLVSAGNPLLWAALCSYLNNLSILYADHIQPNSDITAKSCEGRRKCERRAEDSCYLDAYKEIPNDFLKPEASTSVQEKITEDSAIVLSKTNYTNEKRGSIHDQKYKSSSILEGITARFFGIHGMIYHSCHVTGNIVAYFVLRVGAEEGEGVTNSTCPCGADFCNGPTECFDGNLRVPSDEIRYTLAGVCVLFAIVSVALVALFLDELKKKESVSFSLELLMASCKLLKRWNLILLIPMTFYIGVLQGFVMGDYTQAFVGCAWGIHNIALVLAAFGFTLALSSSVCGWFVKYLGRPPIFLFIATLNGVIALVLLLWRPDGKDPAMMFVIGGCLGFVLGTYWSQSRAFYGVLFKEDEEAAFGNYQIWFCCGAFLSFGYSKILCTSIKIYLMLLFSTLAILGYLAVERNYLKTKKINN